VAFTGFASALAYFSQRDRLPKSRPSETSPKHESAPAERAVKISKAA
jgi:hypothetical protein